MNRLIFLLICCLSACQLPNNTVVVPTSPPPIPTVELSEEELLELTSVLVAKPQNQEEKEHNAIVEHLINNNLFAQQLPSRLWLTIHERKDSMAQSFQWGQRAKVHYVGTFLDGEEFDNSYKKGQPLSFYVGNMIHGWNEALQHLQSGDHATILVPSRLGYGQDGLISPSGEVLVPPNAPLRFDLFVL